MKKLLIIATSFIFSSTIAMAESINGNITAIALVAKGTSAIATLQLSCDSAVFNTTPFAFSDIVVLQRRGNSIIQFIGGTNAYDLFICDNQFHDYQFTLYPSLYSQSYQIAPLKKGLASAYFNLYFNDITNQQIHYSAAQELKIQ